jgi:hypothetical protein
VNIPGAESQFARSTVGRTLTRTHRDMGTVQRKAFTVDAEAAMLKRNRDLSRNARILYMAMRALADGKTGELRIKGRWLKATEFDREAEMCREVRMAGMRELIAAGFVEMKRVRVCRKIGDRMRVVLGECQYRVFRTPRPKIDQKPDDSSRVDRLQSISSTVEEIGSQSLPEAPLRVLGSVLGSNGTDSLREHTSSSSESPSRNQTPDDDHVRVSIPGVQEPRVNPDCHLIPAATHGQDQNQLVRIDRQIEKNKARAQAILEGRGRRDPIFVRQAILMIDNRAIEIPATANYYLTAFEALSLKDLHKIEEEAEWIRANGARAERGIAFVRDIIETADRTGESAADVLRERLSHRAGEAERLSIQRDKEIETWTE